MKNATKMQVTEIVSTMFILLFVYTSITKLVGHEGFKTVLEQSPMIGTKANALSWLLPIIELITAMLLFIPATRKWGYASSLILMSVFTIYIFYMIFFTPNLPCSCGGVLANMTWKQHFLFNIFFITLAVIGFRFTLRNKLFIAINRNRRTPENKVGKFF